MIIVVKVLPLWRNKCCIKAFGEIDADKQQMFRYGDNVWDSAPTDNGGDVTGDNWKALFLYLGIRKTTLP